MTLDAFTRSAQLGTVAGGLLFLFVAVMLMRFAWSLKRSPRDDRKEAA